MTVYHTHQDIFNTLCSNRFHQMKSEFVPNKMHTAQLNNKLKVNKQLQLTVNCNNVQNISFSQTLTIQVTIISNVPFYNKFLVQFLKILALLYVLVNSFDVWR